MNSSGDDHKQPALHHKWIDVKEPKNNDVNESEMEHDGYDSHVEYYTRRDDAKYFLMQPVLYLIPLKGKVSSL